eukprot:738737-Amorphochlora_amoeboformis.AAC.1
MELRNAMMHRYGVEEFDSVVMNMYGLVVLDSVIMKKYCPEEFDNVVMNTYGLVRSGGVSWYARAAVLQQSERIHANQWIMWWLRLAFVLSHFFFIVPYLPYSRHPSSLCRILHTLLVVPYSRHPSRCAVF